MDVISGVGQKKLFMHMFGYGSIATGACQQIAYMAKRLFLLLKYVYITTLIAK